MDQPFAQGHGDFVLRPAAIGSSRNSLNIPPWCRGEGSCLELDPFGQGCWRKKDNEVNDNNLPDIDEEGLSG